MSSKIIQFKKKEKIAKETTAVLGVIIPEHMYRMEEYKPEKISRGDFYREILDIKKTLFFSNNADDKTETLVLFDKDKSECDDKTKLFFLEDGVESNAPYTMPIIDWGNFIMLDFDKIFKKI